MPPLLEAVRPRQWVKNVFVAAPVVFAKHLDDVPLLLRALAAVVLFCALSSAVYLWNDLIDIEKDRAHPTKRNRPIASGRLSPRTAKVGATLLGAGGLFAGLLLGVDFGLVAAAYLAQNVVYSLYLKRVVYVDVLVIATGFLLRVVGGAVAVHVWTSPYLLVCTGLLACYLGFGKRAHELEVAGTRAGEQRAVLSRYDARVLKVMLWLSGVATLGAYVMYTLSPHTIGFFHTTRMIYTAPAAAFGLIRFGQIVSRPHAESPTDAMLKDAAFVATVLLWGVSVILLIYFHP
jgi:4-hydroxybenzoate polyprenyltransferase